jgi:hypothetical protein
MNSGEKYTGFAIALAWPATWCKQSGAWYDPLTSFLGFSKTIIIKWAMLQWFWSIQKN